MTLKKYLHPKYIFLIDGTGALLSAFFLGVVLVRFEPYFGMPASVLNLLASIAVLFAIYSMTNHITKSPNWKPYLKFIAFANSAYCVMTAVLLVYFYHYLTFLGIAYFTMEIMIILLIVIIEFKLLKE